MQWRRVSFGIAVLLIALAGWWWLRFSSSDEGIPASPDTAGEDVATLPALQGAEAGSQVPADAPNEADTFVTDTTQQFSGETKLQWLRRQRIATKGRMALRAFHVEALSSRENPTEDELRALAVAREDLARLRKTYEAQTREIDNFDPDAPPDIDDPMSGPPTPVEKMLDLDEQALAKLLPPHLKPKDGEGQGTLLAIREQQNKVLQELQGLEIPAGMENLVRNRLIYLADGVKVATKMKDKAAAQQMLAARRSEFVRTVKEMLAPAPEPSYPGLEQLKAAQQ